MRTVVTIQWLKLVVITTFLSISAFPKSGISNDGTWSFDLHPHPLQSQLSEAEKETISFFYENEKIFCETGHKRQFEIYRDHFPDFIAHFPSEEAAKEAWKHHVYSTTRKINLICLMRYEQSLIADQVFRFMMLEHINSIPVVDNDLLYCGKFVDAERTEKAKTLAANIKKFLFYVQLNEQRWAHAFLEAFASGYSAVILHPDIEYYFQNRFVWESWLQLQNAPDTRHPNHKFTPERKALLDQAVAKGDLQYVIDTMGDCITYPEPNYEIFFDTSTNNA